MQNLVTAAILIIGDEILSGRTLDTNVQTIAKMLGERGIQVQEVRVVPDVIETIVDTVNALRKKFTYVFSTGGIGPTHDDKTAEAMAKAFGTKLERNAEAWRRLVVHYAGEENINAGRAKMADIPVGAALIDNPVSTAPGFILENVHVMAGVPKIMAAMLEGVLPKLQGGAVIHSRSVSADVPESVIAGGLAAIEAKYAGITVGSYPKFTPNQQPHTTIVVRGADEAAVEAAIREVGTLMQGAGAVPQY
ncbi:MAG: competence/damage-inducible protein A [Alphaproteobacteria bacterium]|nr:competence/damage-inducible protein A [Alphaproteobacteria bacterium]